jgi:hypothetical protein
MTAAEDTATVLGYFNAWTAIKTDEVYAFLADDLAFWGPTASYTIKIASFFGVEGGKIRQYETMFDATAFRKS